MSLQNLSQMPLLQVNIWGQKQPKKAIFSQNGHFFWVLFFSNKKFQIFFFEIPKVDYLGGFRTIFRKCIPLPFKQALFWRYAYDRFQNPDILFLPNPALTDPRDTEFILFIQLY